MNLRDRLAAKLSPRHLTILERYIDGPAQVERGGVADIMLQTLIGHRLVVRCAPNGIAASVRQRRPRCARLTDYGREVLASALAIHADRLVALGCVEQSADPASLVPDQPGDDPSGRRVHVEGCRVRDDSAVS